MKRIALVLTVILLVTYGGISLAWASISQLERISASFAEIAESVKPSVVHIKTTRHVRSSDFLGLRDPFYDPFRDFFGDDFFERFFGTPGRRQRDYTSVSIGSGVIVSEDGYILTNNHLVEDADEIVVKLSDGEEYDAEIVGTDRRTDIAVLKIEGGSFKAAKLGDSDEIEVGDWVVAIGNPFGLEQTVTAGIISAKGRANVGIADYEDFIQTDAAINPGNSGGPLVNLKGEVIGINTAIFTRTGGYQGIGFAIPINMARSVMSSLIKEGRVVRGWLGVTIQQLTPDIAESMGLSRTQKGVLVSDVMEDSPASRAGIERGDIIIEYDGHKISDIARLRNLVAQTQVGKKVEIVVLRDGKEKTIRVKVGEQPASLFAGEAIQSELGIKVGDLTDDLRERLGYEDEEGVVVLSVLPGSIADRAGIRKGDLILEVNKHRVTNTKEFNDEVSQSKDSILLLVRSGQMTRYVALKK